MTRITGRLSVRRRADQEPRKQAYNAPSPNEMVMDTGDYVGVNNDPEKDPVAIINPDNLEQEGDQLQDLPLANDCASTPPLRLCAAFPRVIRHPPRVSS